MLKAIIFSTALCASFFTHAAEGHLIHLVNERLSYMKDVAGSKALNHQPIEDLVQEEKVLETTLSQATKKGIDPISLRPFIVAQMDAAKAIQYRYRADWLAQPEQNWKPKDLEIVRAKISQLSTDIIDNIANELYSQGNLDHFLNEKYMRDLNQKNLTYADKAHLLKTLSKVRLR